MDDIGTSSALLRSVRLNNHMANQSHSLSEWHGAMFIHRGYYKEGVFKFILQIPRTYPSAGPTVLFITDMFHPLIGRDGYFNLAQQFPQWRPHKDYLCHVLHYVKNSFREAVILNLQGTSGSILSALYGSNEFTSFT